MGQPQSFDHAEATRLYLEERWRTTDIATRYGVCVQAVSRMLNRAGIDLRTDPRVDCKVIPEEAEQMHEAGWQMRDIALHFGASASAVSKALRKRRGELPRSFAYPRTPMVVLIAHGATRADVAARLDVGVSGVATRLKTLGTTVPAIRRDVLPLTPKQLAAYSDAIDGPDRMSHDDAIELALEY